MLGSTTQKDIDSGGGDVVGRDKIINKRIGKVKISQLRKLFQTLVEERDNEIKISKISEELNDYLTERDVIGLPSKLKEAGCSDNYLNDAEFIKHKFAKKLYHFQEYPSAQKIYVLIMAHVIELFRAKILPNIDDYTDLAKVDNKLFEEVIVPIVDALHSETSEDEVLYINHEEIRGMIYFLTGRCHLRWVL
ncbi:ABC-three component system protein [uncultured Nonlabens sp.]|uniref:ABC-three component system protein n=1 Tax=uncultured Nonlabens sp. TaxID=859306 RepID=UPI002603A8D5|nr:ABC-three component system protein [uncultured Nonlabens sp.]